MIPSPMKLIDCEDFETAFAAVRGSYLNGERHNTQHRQIDPDAMPARYRELLVHNNHMTSALASHYGHPVSLRVLQEQHDDNIYSREILLTLEGSDVVVEYGVVRLDLDLLTNAAQSKILARTAPLGDILMRHEVLRKIEPKWFVRFSAGSPLLAHFRANANHPHENKTTTFQSTRSHRLASSRQNRVDYPCPSHDEAFGRIGIIYCNNNPAIELLEVVVDKGNHP